MVSKNRKLILQVQCYLWLALIAFATIGCSAKQTMFAAFDIAVEKPLTGSKAVTNSVSLVCDSEVLNKVERQSTQQVYHQVAPLLNTNHQIKDLSFITSTFTIGENYILQLAGTSPPLYLMFKKIKIALLV